MQTDKATRESTIALSFDYVGVVYQFYFSPVKELGFQGYTTSQYVDVLFGGSYMYIGQHITAQKM